MGIEMRRSLTLVFFLVAATLGGCSEGILDPKGPIAVAERQILFNSLGIMLAIVIPTILATLIVAFWFRSSNARARYLPDFTYSGRLEILVWSIPAMTVLLVGGVAWLGAHDLDPRRPISSTVKPVSVQVVSLDWKWLFIYPDKGIASVNRLVVPVGVPISFQLTSSGVMNSFFVPQLGGQIYTMSGMTTQLQLQADHSGSYPGLSAQFSGDGFADMRFIVDAVPDEQFEQWVSATRIRRRPKRWPGARPADIFRFGKAKRGSRAFHISQGGSQSVQRNHPGLRDAVRRSALFDGSSVTEGRKMNLLGKLTWSAIPFDQPIVMAATGGMVGAVVLILGWITLKGHWPYLWREWITSVDHKRIGVMYCVLALIMLLRGFADAIMMRSQQAMAAGGAQGYLPPEHFDQVFSAHGTIMIFFMAMPFVIGMMNFVVPLQLGVRDMAFPTLNSVALGLTASGILLTNVSLAVGEFAKTGWVAYPPLSELQYSPGVGVDYYLWALQISGIGTLLTGVNFVTTILKTRAPGMRYMRMPVFCWTALASNLLMVAAFPVLTATFAMLLDRYLGFHFFSTDAQGNPMMYVNLFWVWGHPEVYILILPAFGIFSEVIATFSGKPLFGYRSMVAATMVICVLSFLVWLH
jgi:cytochrome o ubiquinol oxidase subunit II